VRSHLPDELLARRAAAGHLEAFEELLRRYRNHVYRICYRSAGNAEDAEDWAQECFVRAYQKLGSYDPAMPFTPWLLRLVANTCINLAKTRARRQGRLDLGLEADEERVAGGADPAQAALAGDEARRVRAAVDALPPPLRQAVVLRVLEDLSFRELAEVLEVPLQTAASRVRRALLQVRERLERSGSEVNR
jgi:RNA polymerase sigma-70 factor (ECF subfamily)